MEPSSAESLAQTMEPAMEHCWDRSLAASLVPQTASMMATTTVPDLAQTRDQSWAATTAWAATAAPSWVYEFTSCAIALFISLKKVMKLITFIAGFFPW